MPYVATAEGNIHYQTMGSGPLVVLLHGLLMRGDSWLSGGVAQTLSRKYCVFCPDLLGHGSSARPRNAGCYSQQRQASSIAALIDAAGHRQAHIIGYSSGAWLAIGLAKHYPDRLASLSIGGWDVAKELPAGPEGRLSFAAFMTFARRTAPALTEWITTDDEPAISAAFSALQEYDGLTDSQRVLSLSFPRLLWAGRDDSYHAPMQTFAEENHLPFFSVAGDHVGAMLQADDRLIENLSAFIA